jgi:membrane-associated protease RseP (regulator of RpoE activity)
MDEHRWDGRIEVVGLRDREGSMPVTAVEEPDPRPLSDYAVPLLLFVATVFTTLWAGAYATRTRPMEGAIEFLLNEPASLLNGLPFAGTLLGILVTHECGHYVLSRIHGVPTSFPLFIPGPPHFIGTFGAIIRMRGPILNRKALFDIGVAGPIAGFVVALAALVIGLDLSKVVANERVYGLHLGEPLLLQFVSWLVIGPLPDGYDVVLHPVGFAAWFGLFVTSLNLIPIGQLDGGHVAYALWGERQRTMALAIIPILIVLGFVGWPGWFLWAGLAGLVGFAHPPVLDPEASLGRTRIWVGWGALMIFVLTFAPIPFSVH